MDRFIIDDDHAFTLDGIRCVEKHIDQYREGFILSIDYKGNRFLLKYPTQAKRDETFRKICEGLEARNRKNKLNQPTLPTIPVFPNEKSISLKCTKCDKTFTTSFGIISGLGYTCPYCFHVNYF